MEGSNKDVVAARINLDMTKILPGFKQLDEGARNNAQSFEVLNKELAETQKMYNAIASAANKSALTSEERRNKILAESDALVKQRTAQAELLNAKKNQLDQTNKITEEKLKAQQMIVKQRQDAILQQESEHQKKLVVIQQKSLVASSQENLNQTKIDRQFQIMKNGHRKLELEEERHHAKMAQQAQMFQAKMAQVSNDASVLNRSSQYLLAGSMYYSIIRGATEAISVIKSFEYEMVNVKRVMGDTADVEFVKKSAIENAKEFGYALTEVGEVYTLIAQQGFNERETEALAGTALMAANVEQSFSNAAQAQELMTGAILNLGLAAQDSERLLDKLNEVSNNFPTTSKKILEGMNRVGASAINAKVEVNDLIGYLTVLNQAGFTGSVAGNAIKSFISFSSRDIAIDKLEKYVGTIKHANGDMMGFSELLGKIAEKWDTLADAQRHEITQAVARGDQASRFISLMNNYSKAMEVAAVAENSFGSAQRENALAMTTLEKQTLQLKAVWDEFVITLGDSGLLAILKEVVHTGKLLIDGFNSLPEPIRDTITVTLLLGTAIMTLNTGMRLMTGQSIISMVTGLVNASKGMLGLKVATDVATVSQRAFVATPIGAALTAIALAVGVATTAWSYYAGAQNEVNGSTNTNERDAYALVGRYKELKTIIDSNTSSSEEITSAKTELANVIERISKLMPEFVSGWDENGNALDVNIEKVKNFTEEYKYALRSIEEEELKNSTKSRDKIKEELDLYLEYINAKIDGNKELEYSNKMLMDLRSGTQGSLDEVEIANKIVELNGKLEELNEKIKTSQQSLDTLNGITSTSTDEMNKLVSELEDGETVADDFADSMKEIKKEIEDASSAIKELVGVQENLAKGQSLNASEAADLINKYPELTSRIYKTADGWAFEEKAVEALRKAKVQMAIDALTAERDSANATINATNDRMEAYGIEMDGIRNLAELRAQLLSAQSNKTAMESTVYTGMVPDIFSNNSLYNFMVEGLNETIVKDKMKAEDAELAKIEALYTDYFNSQAEYDERLKVLTDLYSDPDYGKSSSSGKKSSKKSAKNDAFSNAQKQIEHEKAMDRITLEQELVMWQNLQKEYAIGTEERMKLDEKVYAIQKEIIEADKRKAKEAFESSLSYINHQKNIREVSAKEELKMLQEIQVKYKAGTEERMKLDEMVYAAKKAQIQEIWSMSEQWISHESAMGRLSKEAELAAWLRVQERYAKGTEERKKADEQVYAAQKALVQESISNSEKWIAHEKAMGRLSEEEELEAWLRIQSRYAKGTEERKKADEQVYALRMKLISNEEKKLEELYKVQTEAIEKIKKSSIEAIKAERDAFVEAQEEKIKVIEDLIAAERQQYEDDDYEKLLAEKQARVALLQSAVGPEGIKEREDLLKEIEKMQLERERELYIRSLEEEKKKLEDEKEQQKDAYDDQIDQLETHYDNMIEALKGFGTDVEKQAEELKQLQIMKESEKNTEILNQLDIFIADYKSRMATISNLTNSDPKEADLAEYNSNKDAWDKAKAINDKETMKSLSQRNQDIRDKYGITQDTGKLQHFSDGGKVKGIRGQAVPVVAHAGELVLNDIQQSNLFKLLNLSLPKLNFSMPSFSMAAGSESSVVNHNYYTVSTGDVNIDDSSTAKSFWNERDNLVRRIQSRGGGKTR
ncbi:phage tail tape measure protein [Paenibacillus endoradicis]|uniref:phage tail tape measure protein n=1 Tax=Paenibacillus endoradicis TaxID=2972487 RepID=UPI00215925C5|nr:phage tail tape measure protein [Paenibacillus endoradicis]MCR8656929.1 phage tail tape measure protein [Paenibacillus endoradicis]